MSVKEYRVMKPRKRCEVCRFLNDGIATHSWKLTCKVRKDENGNECHVNRYGICPFFKFEREVK